MCNGFATGSSGFRARSPGTLLAHRRSVLGFGPLSKVEGKEGAGFDNVNGDSLLFPGRFGDLPDPEGVSRAAGPGGVKGGDQIGVIGPDVKQVRNRIVSVLFRRQTFSRKFKTVLACSTRE